VWTGDNECALLVLKGQTLEIDGDIRSISAPVGEL